eukprot:501857-Ditylum_brightwellii.AAC.1
MIPKKKRYGVGAVCSVIKRFLHPRKFVDEKYPNATHHEHLDGLIAFRRETCTVNHQQKQDVVFHHKDFETQEIYVMEHYSKVLEEGSKVHIFPLDGETHVLRVPQDDVLAIVSKAKITVETPHLTINMLEDIAHVQAE